MNLKKLLAGNFLKPHWNYETFGGGGECSGLRFGIDEFSTLDELRRSDPPVRCRRRWWWVSMAALRVIFQETN